MSRYRKVHCKIWNDDKFPFASEGCQAVFFHLLTTPYSTPFGLFKVPIAALAAEKRWSEKKYNQYLGEAIQKGFCKYDSAAYVILIPNFLKYNPPASPNVLISWGKVYQEIPACELKAEFHKLMAAYLKDFAEGFLKAFLKGFPDCSLKTTPTQDQNQNNQQNQEQNQELASVDNPRAAFTALKEKLKNNMGGGTVL